MSCQHYKNSNNLSSLPILDDRKDYLCNVMEGLGYGVGYEVVNEVLSEFSNSNGV